MKKGDVCGSLYSLVYLFERGLFTLIFVLRSQFARIDYFQLYVTENLREHGISVHPLHNK